MQPLMEIPLDDALFKVLASDSRREILRLLQERRMTGTEIATRLSLGKPAVSEHLKKLSDAGLVDRHDDPERRWVYFSLSERGRQMLEPRRTRFILVLSIAIVALLVGSVLGVALYTAVGPTAGPEGSTRDGQGLGASGQSGAGILTGLANGTYYIFPAEDVDLENGTVDPGVFQVYYEPVLVGALPREADEGDRDIAHNETPGPAPTTDTPGAGPGSSGSVGPLLPGVDTPIVSVASNVTNATGLGGNDTATLPGNTTDALPDAGVTSGNTTEGGGNNTEIYLGSNVTVPLEGTADNATVGNATAGTTTPSTTPALPAGPHQTVIDVASGTGTSTSAPTTTGPTVPQTTTSAPTSTGTSTGTSTTTSTGTSTGTAATTTETTTKSVTTSVTPAPASNSTATTTTTGQEPTDQGTSGNGSEDRAAAPADTGVPGNASETTGPAAGPDATEGAVEGNATLQDVPSLDASLDDLLARLATPTVDPAEGASDDPDGTDRDGAVGADGADGEAPRGAADTPDGRVLVTDPPEGSAGTPWPVLGLLALALGLLFWWRRRT